MFETMSTLSRDTRRLLGREVRNSSSESAKLNEIDSVKVGRGAERDCRGDCRMESGDDDDRMTGLAA
jgi:hypothetical protein